MPLMTACARGERNRSTLCWARGSSAWTTGLCEACCSVSAKWRASAAGSIMSRVTVHNQDQGRGVADMCQR